MGKIKVKRSGVDVDLVLENELAMQRRAGRPQAEIDTTAAEDLPRYKDRPRPAFDAFELGGVIKNSRTFNGVTYTPEEQAERVDEDLLRPPLGDGTLTLEFVNTLWGLDTYTVVPIGSQAGRFSWTTGETGVVRVDNLELRVVG